MFHPGPTLLVHVIIELLLDEAMHQRPRFTVLFASLSLVLNTDKDVLTSGFLIQELNDPRSTICCTLQAVSSSTSRINISAVAVNVTVGRSICLYSLTPSFSY